MCLWHCFIKDKKDLRAKNFLISILGTLAVIYYFCVIKYGNKAAFFGDKNIVSSTLIQESLWKETNFKWGFFSWNNGGFKTKRYKTFSRKQIFTKLFNNSQSNSNIKKWIKGTLTLIDALKKNSPTQSCKDTTSKYNVIRFATFCIYVFTPHLSHAFVKRCKDFKQNKPAAKNRTGEVVKGKGNKTMSLVPFTWTLYL